LAEGAGGKLTPKKITALTTKMIQAADLALSKVTYIRSLAAWFKASLKVASRS
jgi:hypothetical protein